MPATVSTTPPKPRAVLLGVQLPGVDDVEHDASLTELEQLAKTLGLEVVGRVQQKRTGLAAGVVVGQGKLTELAQWTGGSGEVPKGPPEKRKRKSDEDNAEAEAEAEPEADGGDSEAGQAKAAADGKSKAGVVLVDHDLTPTQLRNLERATGAEVLDRTAVILAIFERHARSREARLQVEIARLTYMAPRLRESGRGGDRSGGGIGAKGAGESAAQLERRKVRDRIAELRSELGQIARDAGHRRERRAASDTVALVGYTNAGKSSLMRGLTGGEVYVADKLFATLDTTVRALVPPAVPAVLVSDTVGFLKKLPHDLVASFRSTLEEAREADLKLHVVDAANPAFAAQIRVTRQVLAEIDADQAPELLLLNKIDRVPAARRAELARDYPDAIQLSARNPADVTALRQRILDFFARDLVEGDLVIPFALQRLVSEAHATCRVLAESYDERGARLRVLARPAVLSRLKA
ncbi:MAG TPA: GTPase HflX, partial [Candidatus Udaeobacter sp.]|nr:GTPase HflX [Candidatus Udaeobacter sp.]